MVRLSIKSVNWCTRSPHTRGDGPFRLWAPPPHHPFSPHAWGWSLFRSNSFPSNCVLPTRVGMVRYKNDAFRLCDCSPHTRGDGPAPARLQPGSSQFSPHAWGWSVSPEVSAQSARVLPTRVGMVREFRGDRSSPRGSPHTRGDGPRLEETAAQLGVFSPHAWGWSVVPRFP